MSYFKRPCAVAATYIIDTARILSPAFNQEEIEKTNRIEQIKREEKIEEISHVLELGIAELKECVHTDDITKTCRTVTRKVYKDISTRSTMLVSQIPFHIMEAIRCKCHMRNRNSITIFTHLSEVISFSL